MKMKIINCRTLASLFAFIVVVYLLGFSSFCLHHGQNNLARDQRGVSLSRKLLSSSWASVSTTGKKLSGSKRQPKKAVEQSLKKAPHSVPNPKHNK
ncbi:CLAVATA3/ESR-related 39 [Quillaja saponaria]|uniref:CLAVATA3/ESR-related 39 n=1 Tax=Quillaja saponaria TaxID=32244 RepID=A0AAD7VD83_QUISA|nr:CLAVATA3/ESR-related 39 [Quillaja saponaria]